MSEPKQYFAWIEDDWGNHITETIIVLAEDEQQAEGMASRHDYDDYQEQSQGNEEEYGSFPQVVSLDQLSATRIEEIRRGMLE